MGYMLFLVIMMKMLMGELNFFMGMYPTESTGFSNNAPARFGPPKWQDAKFEVKNGETAIFDINL